MSETPSGQIYEQERMEVDEDEEDNERGMRIDDIYIAPPPIPASALDPNAPRLMITHISNTNFKSYAGTQVLGPFHKSFTAIVGPNGSGKSNVIDSMLFVFGYRAQKIRSKKVSVLLHKSGAHPNVESCSVSVHFQCIIDKPGDDYEVVPNSQFVVTRTAFKDNSSWYAINGKKVQFREVGRLLRSHGIDLDYNRFLILQGEVEQIAMMKPKAQNEHEVGMLGFLEDIIGSSRFKEPIRILGQRVEEINERRAEKYNRVKAVEKERDELEDPKNEAFEYIKIENSIVEKKNIMFQIKRAEIEDNLEIAVEEKDKMEEKLKEVNDALKELKNSNSEYEEGYKKISKELDKKGKYIEEKKEEYSALERQDLHCRENLKHCKTKDTKLKKLLESHKEKLEDLKELPNKLEANIKEFTEKEKDLEAQKQQQEATLTEVMAGLKQETQSLQEEKEKHESELIGLKKQVDETKSQMDIAQSELDIFLSNEQTAKNKLKEMETNYETTRTMLKNKQEEVSKIEPELSKRENTLKNMRQELETVCHEKATLSEKLKSDRVRVEEARSSMQAFQGRSRVLSALMELKEKGELPGILGRLGDLGAIEQKYDVAISTACGALDNIVTDTMDTAQKCVKVLKQSNLGIATFIALDKMDRWIPYTREKIKTPENVPRLFDLIQVADQKVLPAFYHALRNTLVTDTLDQATRIGLQGQTRYRVVTLKGELIDISGTMSGGGGRPSSGRMGQSVRTCDFTLEQVQRLSAQLEEMIQRDMELRNKQSGLESSITAMEKDCSSLRTSLQKTKVEIQTLIERDAALKDQIKVQKRAVAEAAPDENTVQSMSSSLNSYRKEYEKALKAASVVEEKVQRLHNTIMEITNSRVSGIQKQLDTTKKEINSVSAALSKARASMKTTERDTKKCKDKIVSTEEEMAENEELAIKLKEEYLRIEEAAKNINKELDDANQEHAKLTEKMAEISEEVRRYRKEEAALNRQQLDLKNELDKCNSKVKECTLEIKHCDAQLSSLQLQEVDNQPLKPLPKFNQEELKKYDYKVIKFELSLLQEDLKKMKPNMAAIAEYRKKEALFLQRVAELEEITNQRDKVRQHLDDLRKQRLNEFMTGFTTISTKLKEMYQMITLGGDAELELVDSLDPFSEGIVFSVRPPKKSWKNISNLSGGEKTLSSLALVFALHYYKPTPLYVMDEIDAALDFKNVSIVANYIKDRTKNAQFIIISLRNNMFELADHLVGIYKTHDCTKSVTINPKLICRPETEECFPPSPNDSKSNETSLLE